MSASFNINLIIVDLLNDLKHLVSPRTYDNCSLSRLGGISAKVGEVVQSRRYPLHSLQVLMALADSSTSTNVLELNFTTAIAVQLPEDVV